MAKILIVDDEKRIRRILALMLEERGHQAAEAATGEEALALHESLRPDLVLLDLRLPDADGVELLRRFRERDPRLGVIMMTAHGSIRSAVEAMQAGAFHYLAKPFDNDEMTLLVERALEVRRLDAEVRALRDELESRYGFNEIVGVSPAMQEVFRLMTKVARVDAAVLVSGESGTGKELVARALHRRGARAAKPFVAVNCSAVPETLVEAEFFGHEKGAFTGAEAPRPGKFEQAHGGTLFLDEIGDLALDAQAKLLRSLQERQVVRLGGQRARAVDVRVVTATNKDLEREVADGRFREDLYWRINVVQIRLPPLRQRRGDLPLLVDHLLERFRRELGVEVRTIAPEARRLLAAYAWPGNVRELENTLCRALVLAEGAELAVADLPPRIRGDAPPGAPPERRDLTLAAAVGEATARVERAAIAERLHRFRGNRTETAKSLGVSRKTLFNKMRQHGLD